MFSFKKKKKNKIVFLSKTQIKKELSREKEKDKFSGIIRNTLYTVIIIAAASAIIATLFMPVIQISGTSMEPNYKNGDIALLIKNHNIKEGDVIAFYHGNKVLVKRVIATNEQWVRFDENGRVYVDEKLQDEKYINSFSIGDSDLSYPYQVENLKYFVLSDNREDSIDSRNNEIGSVSYDDIIGKILIKVWPLK